MKKGDHPNILFIMTDQLRDDCLSERSFEKTPILDGLAELGTTFDLCYANAPVCIPSRFSLATGHSVSALGIHDNISVDLNPQLTYWTTKIRDHGYQTALIGKTHLHRHVGDLRDREHLIKSYGFDYIDEIAGPRASMVVKSNMTDLWEQRGFLDAYKEDFEERFSNKAFVARPSVLPDELYADNYVGSAAVDYLRDIKTDKPWFCWVSFGGPHEPWDAPEKYCDKYHGESPPAAIPLSKNRCSAIKKDTLHYQKHQQSPVMSKSEVAKLKINYAANVSLIDEKIGNILDVLRDRNELQNTIIVFTSDHGEMNGDHGLIYKNVLYESAVKIPMLIALPEQFNHRRMGYRSKALVQLSDLGPTLLDLIGIDKRALFDNAYACSFSSLLSDVGNDVGRQYVFSEVAGEVMITDGRWKMILDDSGNPYMLFDLIKDSSEQTNLIFSWLAFAVRLRLKRAAIGYLKRENNRRLVRMQKRFF